VDGRVARKQIPHSDRSDCHDELDVKRYPHGLDNDYQLPFRFNRHDRQADVQADPSIDGICGESHCAKTRQSRD